MERGVVVIGVLAGIHEPGAATLGNLSFFLERFKSAEVQAIAVLGGVGLKDDNVTSILEALSAAPVPVLVTPGAQENFDVFRKAMSKAHKHHPQLIDLTSVRRVRIGHANLISLPGYGNAFYLEAKERGCSYEAGDLKDVAALAEKGRSNVILSASPPKGRGTHATDRGRGGVNIGDPALASMLSEAGIGFGLFGHVYESGGHATGSDGESPLATGVWQESLYLQTGAVDAVPVALVDGGRTAGMAHIVELSGDRARYRTVMAQGQAD